VSIIRPISRIITAVNADLTPNKSLIYPMIQFARKAAPRVPAV